MWCDTCRIWYDSVDGECPICTSGSVDGVERGAEA